MPATTTVRVHRRTRDAISRLSRRHGISSADLLDQLLSRAEEEQVLVDMNRSYADLRSDPDAWRSERAERDAWEPTLLDGLGKH